MAGRSYDVMQTLERQIKDIYFNFSTTDGATFTKVLAPGCYALTRTGAGDYKLELEDKWIALRKFDVIIVDSTARNYTFQIKSYDVNPSTGRAYINFYANITGTPTNVPACNLLGKITLKNTSVF